MWKEYRKTATTWAKKMQEDFSVDTLEGEMQGHAGDYLCRDVEGNVYPCNKDIFEQSYVEVGGS